MPQAIRHSAYLSPPEYNAKFEEASLIVGHAGMGTILKAMTANKPIVVLPRLSALGEHRSDHQVDTARHMQELQSVTVVWDPAELTQHLQTNALADAEAEGISPYASDKLLNGLRAFVQSSVAKPTPPAQPARPAAPAKTGPTRIAKRFTNPAALAKPAWMKHKAGPPTAGEVTY